MTKPTTASKHPPDSTLSALPAVSYTLRDRSLWILITLIAALAVVAQFVGAAVITVGVAAITVLPMVWGLLAGGIVSGQRIRRFPVALQNAASALMAFGVLLLCGRIAFTIGPNVDVLVQAGPALLLQEVGHLFGTIALALPLAVLLRMGPATIGATFSIDREASFAMVSSRYGSTSPQYRGVMTMYVFGTVFGAVLVSLIASLATSFGLFDPLALAMGAGVGSGSMMAAAAAAVASAHPEMASQVLAVAATSNLITAVVGLYVGVYLSLPLAERFYRLLTRGRDELLETATPRTSVKSAAPETAASESSAPPVSVPLWTSVPILLVVGIVVAAIAAGGLTWSIVGGYVIITALTLLGLGISRVTRGKIAAIIAVITLGALISSPISPVAADLLTIVNSVNFLSICTVVLTIAGLSLGKDLPMLRTIGWKIIPVGIVAIAASYLLSVVVAEFALGLWS